VDTSLFVYHHGSETAYLLLYVDEVLTASSPAATIFVEGFGPIHHFLGVHAQHVTGGTLHLSQRQFMIDILDHASVSACKPCSTPADTNPKLSADT
jgi:hypothetical protein